MYIAITAFVDAANSYHSLLRIRLVVDSIAENILDLDMNVRTLMCKDNQPETTDMSCDGQELAYLLYHVYYRQDTPTEAAAREKID